MLANGNNPITEQMFPKLYTITKKYIYSVKQH